MEKIIKDWAGSPGLQFLSSMFLLFFALILVISTGFSLKFWGTGTADSFVWNWNNQVIVSWITTLMVVKAISHFFPKVVAWKARFVTEARIPMFGFLGLLFSLGMVYLDTQVF